MEEAIDWIELNETCWLADIGPRKMPKCSKSVRIILIRILKLGEYHYSYLATTLPWSLCDEVKMTHKLDLTLAEARSRSFRRLKNALAQILPAGPKRKHTKKAKPSLFHHRKQRLKVTHDHPRLAPKMYFERGCSQR